MLGSSEGRWQGQGEAGAPSISSEKSTQSFLRGFNLKPGLVITLICWSEAPPCRGSLTPSPSSSQDGSLEMITSQRACLGLLEADIRGRVGLSFPISMVGNPFCSSLEAPPGNLGGPGTPASLVLSQAPSDDSGLPSDSIDGVRKHHVWGPCLEFLWLRQDWGSFIWGWRSPQSFLNVLPLRTCWDQRKNGKLKSLYLTYKKIQENLMSWN